jgi:hypothetical protein
MHSRMMEAAETLSSKDSAVVVEFLRRMRKAIDSVSS